MNSSSKSFGVYARWTTEVWYVLVHSCEAYVPGARTTNFRNHGSLASWPGKTLEFEFWKKQHELLKRSGKGNEKYKVQRQ
jgi:hypothetical protein